MNILDSDKLPDRILPDGADNLDRDEGDSDYVGSSTPNNCPTLDKILLSEKELIVPLLKLPLVMLPLTRKETNLEMLYTPTQLFLSMPRQHLVKMTAQNTTTNFFRRSRAGVVNLNVDTQVMTTVCKKLKQI